MITLIQCLLLLIYPVGCGNLCHQDSSSDGRVTKHMFSNLWGGFGRRRIRSAGLVQDIVAH